MGAFHSDPSSPRRAWHLELLVLARADPLATLPGTGRGPAHLAAAAGHGEAVAALARLGADTAALGLAGSESAPLDSSDGRGCDA